MINQSKQQYEHLKNKWTDLHRETQKSLWERHGEALKHFAHQLSPRQLAVGAFGGIMLLSASPALTALPQVPLVVAKEHVQTVSKSSLLVAELSEKLPRDVGSLTQNEEQEISGILNKYFDMRVVPEFGDKRLNTAYGYIGQEQHLARFSGDTMEGHLATPEDVQKYHKYGMAPGLGAWGYFTHGELTQKDIDREKYYIAVQTFLSPGFMERFGEYRDFYKYRKMLVVNPENGKGMVVVIGDAGPSPWTKKHLGGSPEVMQYLERVDGSQKGPVLYFFIDDPDDKIALGPVNL